VCRTCSSREVREEEEGCTELTEDFTGRRSDGDKPLVKRSEWRQWSSSKRRFRRGENELQRGIGEVLMPFIGPRSERSGWRGEQLAASVGFNGVAISVPKGNGEEGKQGAGEVVSQRLFEGVWEAS
jgi:hypothetical protein